MTTNIERAAEVIREARLGAPRTRGMEDTISPYIAQALADADLIMPDPAKPAVSSIEGYHTYHPWAIWHAEGLDVSIGDEGTIYIDDETGRNISMSPGQARSLVPVLLAAFTHAEQEQGDEA